MPQKVKDPSWMARVEEMARRGEEVAADMNRPHVAANKRKTHAPSAPRVPARVPAVDRMPAAGRVTRPSGRTGSNRHHGCSPTRRTSFCIPA